MLFVNYLHDLIFLFWMYVFVEETVSIIQKSDFTKRLHLTICPMTLRRQLVNVTDLRYLGINVCRPPCRHITHLLMLQF